MSPLSHSSLLRSPFLNLQPLPLLLAGGDILMAVLNTEHPLIIALSALVKLTAIVFLLFTACLVLIVSYLLLCFYSVLSHT